ncbi:hypothetical protein AGLY_006325 [Aphis glycines]|uniref:Uncharacterized protein n=1 Tax=Aphis glycines TaxID=307491 RepID=A0A6G0TRA4_APHGL|nr:hypothetical protein AGLY_006325 [Aphis glycines]
MPSVNEFESEKWFIRLLWKRDSADANGQTSYHIVRDSGHAVVSVVPVQHRRHTCQELQVDIREMLPLPELQETPKTHVGHTAKGTVEEYCYRIRNDFSFKALMDMRDFKLNTGVLTEGEESDDEGTTDGSSSLSFNDTQEVTVPILLCLFIMVGLANHYNIEPILFLKVLILTSRLDLLNQNVLRKGHLILSMSLIQPTFNVNAILRPNNRRKFVNTIITELNVMWSNSELIF